MVCLTVILGVIGVIVALLWWFHRPPENFPPGPTGLPILGYAPLLGKKPHIGLTKLGEKYGSVFSVSFGASGPPCIVLNDWKSMKEALVDKAEAFLGRPQTFLIKKFFRASGIVFAEGELWKENRRFALHHLRNLGFGKTSMETIIADEIQQLLDNIDSKSGQKIVIADLLFLPILNIIWGLVGGNQYAMNDDKMKTFSSTLKNFFELLQKSVLIDVLPILRFLPGELSNRYQNMRNYDQKIMQFMEEELKRHKATYREEVQRDFIDVYLAEIYKLQAEGKPSQLFQDKQLIGTMRDFFSAGVETTLHTLSWAFLYMAVWPEIQAKVHEELDRIIGSERSPAYSDRPLLPYTEAVLLETHRYATIVPLSVPHMTSRSTQLMGYTIPAATFVVQNLWAVHHDPKNWDEPEIFRPERFLNHEGAVQKPEHLIPFSMGARFCLGEPLARMELFLFFTAVLHRFSLHCVTGEKPPSLDPCVSVTLSPQPFSIVFRGRF